MGTRSSSRPSIGFWIVGVVALVWNVIGILTYLGQVTMSPETLAAMPEAERLLYTDIPAWATGAYAIAVFVGTLASVALLLRKSWAVPLFAVSLIGILVQFAHALFMTGILELYGAAAAVMPVFIIGIAVFLLWYSVAAKGRAWLS